MCLENLKLRQVMSFRSRCQFTRHAHVSTLSLSLASITPSSSLLRRNLLVNRYDGLFSFFPFPFFQRGGTCIYAPVATTSNLGRVVSFGLFDKLGSCRRLPGMVTTVVCEGGGGGCRRICRSRLSSSNHDGFAVQHFARRSTYPPSRASP